MHDSSSPSKGFFDNLTETPFVQWVLTHSKQVWIAVFVGIAVLIGISWVGKTQRNKAQSDYLQAEGEYSLFQRSHDPEVDATNSKGIALRKLEEIMERRPELHAKYDGLIAQVLLSRGEYNEAKPYALSAIAQLEKEPLSLYYDYSLTSLLISNKEYEKALKNALALKDKIPKDDSLLYSYNLARIASLQMELGQTTEAQNTWKEWEETATISQKEHFSDGSVSLPDYIKDRT